MGKSGNHGADKDRQLLDAELNAIQMPVEQEADLIGNTVLSVLRDFGLGGHYGEVLFSANVAVAPTLATVYQPGYVEAVAAELGSIAVVKSTDVLLYTGWGDMIGSLSRLLVVARETAALKPFLAAANIEIAKLGIEATHMVDVDYIRHFRNAVAHARFGVEIAESDPFASRIVFIDADQRAQRITAKLKLTSEQLAKVMRIMIHEVFEEYLLEVGWEARSERTSMTVDD